MTQAYADFLWGWIQVARVPSNSEFRLAWHCNAETETEEKYDEESISIIKLEMRLQADFTNHLAVL